MHTRITTGFYKPRSMKVTRVISRARERSSKRSGPVPRNRHSHTRTHASTHPRTRTHAYTTRAKQERMQRKRLLHEQQLKEEHEEVRMLLSSSRTRRHLLSLTMNHTRTHIPTPKVENDPRVKAWLDMIHKNVTSMLVQRPITA